MMQSNYQLPNSQNALAQRAFAGRPGMGMSMMPGMMPWQHGQGMPMGFQRPQPGAIMAGQGQMPQQPQMAPPLQMQNGQPMQPGMQAQMPVQQQPPQNIAKQRLMALMGFQQ